MFMHRLRMVSRVKSSTLLDFVGCCWMLLDDGYHCMLRMGLKGEELNLDWSRWNIICQGWSLSTSYMSLDGVGCCWTALDVVGCCWMLFKCL